MSYDTRWSSLLSGLMAQMSGDDGSTEISANHVLTFEHDGLVIELSLHPTQPRVMLSVEILALDSVHDDAINQDRFRTLHHLNALSFFEHSTTAVVTPSDLLVLCAQLDLRALESHELIDQVNLMVERAKYLRDSWGQLGALLANESEANTHWPGVAPAAFV